MEFDRAVAELEALITTLERESDERALLLLELVDAIHRPALELIAAGEREHPIAKALLTMYDLAEAEDEMLADEALDEIRPYIESHGGVVELIRVEDGVVHVRMSGACHGCAASAMTLRRGIEEVLRERIPGFRGVVSHPPEKTNGMASTSGPQLLQIETAAQLRAPRFVAIETGDLESNSLAAHEVEGVPVLLVYFEGELYAFRNYCPVDGGSLEGGRLAGSVIVCPWHNCAYDARNGRRLDGENEPGLDVVPIAAEGGAVRVAVNVL